MVEKFNAWVVRNVKTGSAQLATFVGAKTGKDGITSKVIRDDVSVNEPVTPPPDLEKAVLVAGLNIETEMNVSYDPTIAENQNRMTTCNIEFRTLVSPLKPGAYGVGANMPNTSPSNNSVSPKL